MRAWLALAAVTAIVAGAAAELVFDIRTPRSGLPAAGALAAVVSFPTGEPDPPKKLAGMYGLFVVKLPNGVEQLFPFSIVPATPVRRRCGRTSRSCATASRPVFRLARMPTMRAPARIPARLRRCPSSALVA